MLQNVKILSAVTTWTMSLTFAWQAKPGQWGLAIFVATIACVPTFWVMIDLAAATVTKTITTEIVEAVRAERQHTEELVLAVAVEFAQAEVTRLAERRT